MSSATRANLLINRDYARLWWGQAISVLGDHLFDATLTVWVAIVLMRNNAWAPIAVSGVVVCIFAAYLVGGPVLGVFVDRWNRRHTMLATEAARTGLASLLAVAFLLPVGAIPVGAWLSLVYAVVFALNVLGQAFNPARLATIGEIVPGEADQVKAFGLGQAASSVAGIAGPLIAPPLLFTVGIEWAMVANAVSYLVSYLMVRAVRFPAAAADVEVPRPVHRWSTDFGGGLRFFFANRTLVVLVSMSILAQFGTGALNALNIFFIVDVLHMDVSLIGAVTAAFGLGSVIGALAAPKMVRRFSTRTTVWLGMLASGVLTVLYSRQTVFAWAVIVIIARSIPSAALNSTVGSLILTSTPKDYVGRVMAVYNPAAMVASITSSALCGWLASTSLRGTDVTWLGLHFGPNDILLTAGGLLIVAGGLVGWLFLPRTTVSTPPVTPALAIAGADADP